MVTQTRFWQDRPRGPAPYRRSLGATIDSTVNGVHLGASTYSFRDFPRTPGQDIVDPVIQALQFCKVGEIELYSPTIEPAGAILPPEPPAPYGMPRPPRVPRTEEQAALEKSNREGLAPLARVRARLALRSHRQKVRQRRRQSLRLHRQLQRHVHRRRNRRRLPPGQGAARRVHRHLHHAEHGAARRALRRQAPGHGRAARQFQPRPQPLRLGGELRQGHGTLEVLQGEPRHRPLHRRQLRRRRLHPREPRPHHAPAHQRPQKERRHQREVSETATPRSNRCSPSSRKERTQSEPSSNTNTSASEPPPKK